MGLTTDGISNEEWRQAGIGATVAGALMLFASFFFGGYTAGRMGRRAGTTHGLGVFGLAALLLGIGAAIAAGVAMQGDRWHTRLTRAALDSHEARREDAERTEHQPDRTLGDDPTPIDLRDDETDRQLSIEEERKRARAES